MRIVSSLTSFIFLGYVTAGAVPDIAGRNIAVADGEGGKGGSSASMSGVYPHPSGFPTGVSIHSIPSSIRSQSSASHEGANPTDTHSIHPMSTGAEQTGGHFHHSGSPTGASGYPIPSAETRSHSPASRGAQPTDTYHTAGASGAHSPQPGQPTMSFQLHRSGAPPSGASDYPGPSISRAPNANPSDMRGHRSGSPSGISVQPQPTMSYA